MQGRPQRTWRDPVIEAYKKDVDRTLLRENLKLTVQQRFDKFQRLAEYARELRETGHRAARRGNGWRRVFPQFCHC